VNPFFETLTTIALAIVTLGIVSVVVSKKAQTPAVIQAAGSAFGNSLAVAESPVTGATYKVDLSYPSSGFGVQDFSGSFGYG
jgi:hypothetical protein